MNTHMKAELAIDARDVIGEGPAWDAERKRFLWLDNAVGVVHEAKLGTDGDWRESRRWNLRRLTGAVIPRADGGLLVVSGLEVLALDEAGRITPFARIDADATVVRFNDAKCDPQGRLWAGTMSDDFSPRRGALYRIDPDGTVTTVLTDVSLSNGLDWSPDEGTFYYIDTLTASVDAFDFDAASGAISRRRTVVTIPISEGGLDGMTVDQEGCLWLAIFGPGEVRRYSPGGKLLMSVETSAPAVTSCAFGGIDGRDLLITSASLRIPDPVLPIIGWSVDMANSAATAPGAGGIFVCRPGVIGRPATPFAG